MSSLPFVLLLTSCAYSYNLSEMASWGPALAASQLGTTIRESVPQPVSRVDSRSPRMAFETPEHWNFNSKPMEYYQPPADSSDERRIYVQPERKYGESYKITIPEETEYSHCQEHKSTEDGLTQIANVVSKVAKMLFGASVILLLPLIMAKLFFFPLKLFLAMKILLKLMLLWPFLMRSFPGMMPTPSVEAKLVVPSVIDTARELVDFLEVQYYSDSNDTRSPKVLNNFGGTMNSTSDYLNSSSEFAPYCDVKMSCFMSKSMSSKHYITKLVTSAAILFGKESIRHPRFMKFLENKSEFKECAQMVCPLAASETNTQ